MHYPLLQILSPVLNDREFRASELKQKSSKELWRIVNNFLNILFLKQTTLQENLEKPEFKLQHKICLQIQGENIFCIFRRKTKHLHRFCLAFSAVLAKQYWKNLYHFGYLMLVELKEKHIMYKTYHKKQDQHVFLTNFFCPILTFLLTFLQLTALIRQ